MFSRSIGVILAGTLLISLAVGCNKQPSDGKSAVREDTSVVRVHWAGKKRISTQKDAAYLMSIWDMPEAKAVESEALDKLSLSPWSIREGWKTNSLSSTNATSLLLRTLAEDLLQEESYLEIRQPSTNRGPEWVLALKLSEARAGAWRSNLATALTSLTGIAITSNTPSPGGWSLKKHDYPNLMQFVQAGGWTLVGLASDTNSLLADFHTRIRKNNIPFAESKTNYWLELDADLAKLKKLVDFGLPLPKNLPRVALTFIGEGDYLRTRGQFNFAQAPEVALSDWVIPTNLVREPLISFTAIRGFEPVLSKVQWLKDQGIQPVPNQSFLWALGLSPAHSFSAAPMPGASNLLAKLGPLLPVRLDPLISQYARANLEYITNRNAFLWSPMPFVTPVVEVADDAGREFLIGRLSPALTVASNTAPAEMYSRLTSQSNLVYYDWELTNQRMMSWIFLGQSSRLLFWFPQVPRGSSTLSFMTAVGPRLGNTITEIKRSNPDTFELVRKSHIGLTGFEMQLVADWLASPQFPRGLNLAIAPKLPKPVGTNVTPATIIMPGSSQK